MSLSYIRDIRPFPNYAEPGEGYTELYTDPVTSLHRFVYSEARDQFIVAGLFAYYWMGVRTGWMANLYFNGETGEYEGALSAPWNYWQVYYMNMEWSQGSFGKIYSASMEYFYPTHYLSEIDIDTRLPVIYMAIPSTEWNPETTFTICSYCMERNEGIVITHQGPRMEVWNLSDPYAPVFKSMIEIPGTVSNLCYENKDLMWLITEDGIIAKFNYELTYPRYEVLSSVQNPGGDTLGYRITYDSKRKRVVVFRIRDDAEGKNQSSFEFYRPYYIPSMLTDPVPTGKIVGGYNVNFIGHLLGSTGEGVAGQNVIPSLSEGSHGQLLTKVAPTTLNGSFTVKYFTENALYTDTLEVEHETTEFFE